MSNQNLGLTESQLSFLNLFKDKPHRVFSVRTDVFNRQKQQLTQCAKLIDELNRDWEALKRKSDNFKVDFPALSEKNIAELVSQSDAWCEKKALLDKTILSCSEVYVSSNVTKSEEAINVKKQNLVRYIKSAKEYLVLCNIDRELRAEYKSNLRNYSKIAELIEKYEMLPIEIQKFAKSDFLAIFNEFKRKVDNLTHFNQSMQTIGKGYSDLPSTIKVGNYVFNYDLLSKIKKEFGIAGEWVRSFERLSSWLDTLSDDDKEILIGSTPAAKTNLRGEYDTYLKTAEKIKKDIIESRYFYKAAEVCSLIQAASKEVPIKKKSVQKAQSAYDALRPEESKYVRTTFVNLLLSMAEGSDLSEQIEKTLSVLEDGLRKLVDGVKRGNVSYSYGTIDKTRCELMAACEWADTYNSLTKMLSSAAGKVKLSGDIHERINKITAASSPIKKVAQELTYIEEAYEFESNLNNLNITFDTDEATINSYKTEFNKLTRFAQGYVSVKYVDIFTKFTAFKEELTALKKRIEKLTREYEKVNSKLVPLSYPTYSEYRAVEGEANRLEANLETLKKDIASFKSKYSYEGTLSVKDIEKYYESVQRHFKTNAVNDKAICDCYALYRWAINYRNASSKFGYKKVDLIQKRKEYEIDLQWHQKLDTENTLAPIFELVSSEIIRLSKEEEEEDKRLKKRVERERRARYFRECRATIFKFILNAAFVIAIIVTAVLSFKNIFNNSYWVWFASSVCVSVVSVISLAKSYESKALNIVSISIYSALLLGASLPYHLKMVGDRYWYLALLLLVLAATIIINISVYDSSKIFNFIYCMAVGLVIIGGFICGLMQNFQEANYLENTFFGFIANIFIWLWTLVTGAISAIVRVLSYFIGGAYWIEGLWKADIVLNTILIFSVIAIVVHSIIAKIKDEDAFID